MWIKSVAVFRFFLILAFLSLNSLGLAETLEQSPPQETRGSFVLFQPARTLTIPQRTTADLTSQWQVWIRSTQTPSADNEVPLETAGLILQVGIDQSEDDRWCQIAFRYFTGPTASEQRRLYPVNFQIPFTPVGTTGTFRYWRTVWIPLLPQEGLSVEKWFPELGKTTPSSKFLGYVHGKEG